MMELIAQRIFGYVTQVHSLNEKTWYRVKKAFKSLGWQISKFTTRGIENWIR